MMKTTTEASRLVTITSWIISTIVFGGVLILIWYLPSADGGVKELSDRDKPIPKKEIRARKTEQIKKDQSERALPPKYVAQLVEQSEIFVKKELQQRIERFEEMSVKMRQRKNELLDQVETRKLPRSAPSDANDTREARNIPVVQNQNIEQGISIDQLYELLRRYEKEIQENNLAVNAAKRTLKEGLSFPEVYNSMQLGSSLMPGFEQLISNQVAGEDWQRSSSGNASANLMISSTADLNNYRELLGQASRQVGLAGSRLEGLFGVARPVGMELGSSSEGGSGSGNGGMAVEFSNSQSKTPMRSYRGSRLNQQMVKAQALPGRRFSEKSDRKGWLYVNTWYMIGPWENYGRDDFAIVHPPEISVDFDAVYTDGQIGEGVAETDSHPLKMIGTKVQLDGTLRWQFMQSESMHNAMPVTTGHSTYYAYTELYFDEGATMLVAIGTDDSGRLWINGKDVWRDSGTSWYHIDESITRFNFHQGWNRVLVRLENGGGGPAGFSFLICPPEAVSSSTLD